MPRFHFNVYDGHSTIDTEGTDLSSWQDARREAVRLAGTILTNEADDLLLGGEWRLEVADPTGLILFRLDFGFQESAAVTGRHAEAGRRSVQ